MGLSANVRYQILGGTDRVLVSVMPLTVFRIYQAAIRALNNVIGGISFVTLARILGVQKSGSVPVAEPPKEPEPVVAQKGKKAAAKTVKK